MPLLKEPILSTHHLYMVVAGRCLFRLPTSGPAKSRATRNVVAAHAQIPPIAHYLSFARFDQGGILGASDEQPPIRHDRQQADGYERKIFSHKRI